MKKVRSLHKSRDFAVLLRRGRRVESPFFKIISRPNGLADSRFVFSISKNTAKSAVLRNRLRRRIREWVRQNPNLFDKTPQDIFFSFRKEAVLAARRKFYEELERLGKALQNI